MQRPACCECLSGDTLSWRGRVRCPPAPTLEGFAGERQRLPGEMALYYSAHLAARENGRKQHVIRMKLVLQHKLNIAAGISQHITAQQSIHAQRNGHKTRSTSKTINDQRSKTAPNAPERKSGTYYVQSSVLHDKLGNVSTQSNPESRNAQHATGNANANDQRQSTTLLKNALEGHKAEDVQE